MCLSKFGGVLVVCGIYFVFRFDASNVVFLYRVLVLCYIYRAVIQIFFFLNEGSEY